MGRCLTNGGTLVSEILSACRVLSIGILHGPDLERKQVVISNSYKWDTKA
jgi:hypothetical protein